MEISKINVENISEMNEEKNEVDNDDDDGGIYTKKFISSKKWEWRYLRVSLKEKLIICT